MINPTLGIIIAFYSQEAFPSTCLIQSSVEVELKTDRGLYLDMRINHTCLKLQLIRGRLFDLIKHKGRTKSTPHQRLIKEFLLDMFMILKISQTIVRRIRSRIEPFP